METLPSTRAMRLQQLRALPLFRGLSDDDMRRLAEHVSLRAYAQGETLFLQGTAAAAFFVVLDGAVQVVRGGAGGREQVLHVFGPGQLVGEVPVFRGGAYPATATVRCGARVARVPRDGLMAILRERPEVALALLAGVCERLHVFVDRVDELALRDVTARLAAHLLRLCAEQRTDIVVLPTTKRALASLLGTVPETLSRRLRALRTQRVLRVAGRRLHVLRPEVLRALAEA